MRYPIDVVHLDREGRVLLIETLVPWRVGRFVWAGHSVVELAGGESSRLGIVAGRVLCLIEETAHATTKC